MGFSAGDARARRLSAILCLLPGWLFSIMVLSPPMNQSRSNLNNLSWHLGVTSRTTDIALRKLVEVSCILCQPHSGNDALYHDPESRIMWSNHADAHQGIPLHVERFFRCRSNVHLKAAGCWTTDPYRSRMGRPIGARRKMGNHRGLKKRYDTVRNDGESLDVTRLGR